MEETVSNWQRIKSIVSGLFMLLAVLVILISDESVTAWIVLALACTLILKGLNMLVYYFTMARHMVGGMASLLAGVLLIDFGVLSVSFSDEPLGYMFLYLAGWNAFSGLIALLRALEARRNGGRSWKFNTLYGVINISVALACLVYRDKPEILCQVYCLGLGYSGIVRIVNGFRRTEIVYIQ